jgi:murein L,D-transpeptidase YafK
LNRSPIVRTLLLSAALGASIALAGCNTDSVLPMSEKAARPLPEKLVEDIESKNMDKDSPILVRLFKEEAELEVWKQDRTGRFALLKTYPICRWSGELGPKIREGDRQAPEGFYNITPGQMNPNSQYYLSFDLGYPNAFDRAHGRTGSQLMVHGDCSSRGCYSMTDEQISEIYALGRDAFFGGQKSFQVQAYPFRMTAMNLAKHRNNPNMPFWRMLKVGNDHFEVTHLEPKVNVCEKHYVFDADSPNGRPLAFSASGRCPAFQVSEDIATAVKDKERQDDMQFADLVRKGTPTVPVKTYADGGMNEVFVAAVKNNQIGVHPQDALFVSTPPGTIPATVRPPRIPELADAPVMRGEAPPPQAPEITLPQLAIAEPAADAPKPASKSSGGLFGSLFSSNSSKSTDGKADSSKSANPLDRMARLVGLGGDDKPKKAEAAPPKPKPAARPVREASHGAIRPKPAHAEPVRAEPVRAAEPAPAAQPARTAETAVQWPNPPAPAPAPAPRPQAPANTAMNGAAPVVPAGSFDSRWSAFR